MFNFTTQTVLNSITVGTAGSALPAGTNVIKGGTGMNPQIRIGNLRFNKADVIDIQIKNHTPENLAKVTFDLNQVKTIVGANSFTGDYRIVLYLGLSMNSQDSFYANDFVYKGKPFYIEFPVKNGDTPGDVVERIAKIANKYTLLVAQEKILNVTTNVETEDDVNEAEISFQGVNGYQIIKKAVLQRFDPEAKTVDCCTTQGEFVDVITGVPVTWTADNTGVITVGTQTLDSDGLRDLKSDEVAIEPGIEAFGDYNWMIHNLRLPTLANTYFWSPTKNEQPVVGGTYTQFIIRMKRERDGIAGEMVGQRGTSVTTHVLYVLDQGNNISTLKSALIGANGLVTTAKTDADTALSTPFAG